MPLAAPDWTHIVRVSLIVVVHVAIVEVHVPGVRRIVGVGSTGPVVVGLASALIVHSLDPTSIRGWTTGTDPFAKGTNSLYSYAI